MTREETSDQRAGLVARYEVDRFFACEIIVSGFRFVGAYVLRLVVVNGQSEA